jgi:hypothetical protein
LISGTTSGTSSGIRYDDELLMTGKPAAANATSASTAMSEGKLEITRSQSSGGLQPNTFISFAASGISKGSFQLQTSAKRLPSERSEAASAVTSKYG